MRTGKLSIVLGLAIAVAPVSAQEERLSLEWIFSEEGKTATSVPRHTWLNDGSVVLYDSRADKRERTLELYNPANGRRRALVDAEDAVASLTEILEPEEPFEELGWPDAIGPNGRWAAYVKSDNILLLNIRSSEFIPVAVSDTTESSPKFSPNGEWLAFVRDNDLFAFNIDDKKEIRLTSDGTDTLLNGVLSWVYWEELLNRSDRGFVWSPDSSAIAYLQTDDSGVGEMHYVDFEPNLPKLIKQRHPKPGTANPRVRAGVVTIADPETSWIDLGTYPHEYLVRVKWLPDSKQVAVQTLNRLQTDLDIFIADAESGDTRHVMRESNEGWVNVHDDLYFLANGNHFIWQSERDGYAHLYLFNMQGQLQHQITKGEWALRPSGGASGMDQAVSYVDEAAGVIYFTGLEKNSTERQLYRIGIDGSNMERLSAADGTHAIYFNPNGKQYLDAHSSIDRAPSLAVFNLDGELINDVTTPADSVAERFDLQTWELLSIRARDGFEMPAMMLKPRYFDPESRYPVVVYVYGGPSAPTVVNAWPGRARGYYHQLLADSGVIVLYVDNRSAAGKSKIDANTIVNQLYGPVELNDLLDGVAWLKSQSYVDSERVGVWGWSGGGTMTLQSMTESEEFTAGAAVAPVTDWHYYDTIYTERYMKRPQDNEDGYEATSHAKRAADLHGRLLLVHGTYDDNVHPQNSWAISDGLIEAGITFDMMIYPMRKHGISDDAAQLHVFKSMYEFWQRNLALGD